MLIQQTQYADLVINLCWASIKPTKSEWVVFASACYTISIFLIEALLIRINKVLQKKTLDFVIPAAVLCKVIIINMINQTRKIFLLRYI